MLATTTENVAGRRVLELNGLEVIALEWARRRPGRGELLALRCCPGKLAV